MDPKNAAPEIRIFGQVEFCRLPLPTREEARSYPRSISMWGMPSSSYGSPTGLKPKES